MLVDLGRNDLGRVCEYGSVTVDELMTIETYSHVMHIVSSVSGTLSPGVSPMDALRASLPAGTLSGAPRSARCRSSTSWSPSGAVPTAAPSATSRTRATSTPASTSAPRSSRTARCTCQAGGGIVADSDPAYEVRETEAKAGAVMDAIRLACDQGDWA